MKLTKSTLRLAGAMLAGTIFAALTAFQMNFDNPDNHPPITLLTPNADEGLSIPHPHFTWQEESQPLLDTANPVTYQIQIATDSEFTRIIDEDNVNLNRYVPDKPLPQTDLYWRVRALSSDGGAGGENRSETYLSLEGDPL